MNEAGSLPSQGSLLSQSLNNIPSISPLDNSTTESIPSQRSVLSQSLSNISPRTPLDTSAVRLRVAGKSTIKRRKPTSSPKKDSRPTLSELLPDFSSTSQDTSPYSPRSFSPSPKYTSSRKVLNFTNQLDSEEPQKNEDLADQTESEQIGQPMPDNLVEDNSLVVSENGSDKLGSQENKQGEEDHSVSLESADDGISAQEKKIGSKILNSIPHYDYMKQLKKGIIRGFKLKDSSLRSSSKPKPSNIQVSQPRPITPKKSSPPSSRKQENVSSSLQFSIARHPSSPPSSKNKTSVRNPLPIKTLTNDPLQPKLDVQTVNKTSPTDSSPIAKPSITIQQPQEPTTNTAVIASIQDSIQPKLDVQIVNKTSPTDSSPAAKPSITVQESQEPTTATIAPKNDTQLPNQPLPTQSSTKKSAKKTEEAVKSRDLFAIIGKLFSALYSGCYTVLMLLSSFCCFKKEN